MADQSHLLAAIIAQHRKEGIGASNSIALRRETSPLVRAWLGALEATDARAGVAEAERKAALLMVEK